MTRCSVFFHSGTRRPPPRNLTVMRYGSLPLRTYLPDGDVDLVIATFDEYGVLENDAATEGCLDL